MADLTHWIEFGTAAERTETAQRWNRLWSQSTSRLPVSRFEQIELWGSTFVPGNPVRGLILERDGRWVAGWPLLTRRIKGVLPVWDVPHDDWTGTHELLVAGDVSHEPAVYDRMLVALRAERRSLLRIPQIATNSAAAQGLIQALARQGLAVDVAPRHDVGLIEFTGPSAPADWETYQAAWSGNFRRQLRKMTRRAEELGGIELVVHRPTAADDVASLIRQGFEIEDRSWKGRSGSSVLRTPGMLEYFTHQARLLAEQRELILLFLKHADKLIAFEYGWSCRGVYYSPKVGFDEEFSHLSPGQMIRQLWIERLFSERSHEVFDFSGPIAEATAKWATASYALARIVAATSGWGNSLLASHRLATKIRSAAVSGRSKLRQIAPGWLKRPAENAGGLNREPRPAPR